MRIAPFLLAALLALSSGCIEDDADQAPVEDPVTMQPSNATLPDEIHATESVSGSADPLNLAMQPICTTPTAQCFEYPFTVEGNATVAMTADLTWDLPANDFDFYLYEGETQAISGASDVTAGPGNAEHMEGPLSAGDYAVVVVAWGVAEDTFTLDVTFA